MIELTWLQWINERFGQLQPIARVLTELGGEVFLFLLIAIVYFVVDKRKGEYLATVTLMSGCINGLLKTAVGRPRPFVSDPALTPQDLRAKYIDSYSFPSGHSQNSAAFYTSVMMLTAHPILKGCCVMAILIVPFTRILLGVHYVTDVTVGVMLGVTVAMAISLLWQKIVQCNNFFLIASCCCAGVVFLVFLPISFFTDTIFSGKIFGAAAGFFIGVYVERSKVGMHNAVSAKQRVLRMLLVVAISAAVALSIYYLFTFFPSHFTLEFVKYYLITGVIMGVIPLCIKKLAI